MSFPTTSTSPERGEFAFAPPPAEDGLARAGEPCLLLRALTIGSVVVATLTAAAVQPIWKTDRSQLYAVGAIAVVAAVAILLPWIERAYTARFDRTPREWPWCSPRLAVRLVSSVAVFVLCTAGFFVAASDALYGDAVGLPYYVEKGFWFHKRAPLAFTAYQVNFRLLGDAQTAIQLTSAIGGGIGVLAALAFGALLAPGRRWMQLAFAAFVLSSGSIVLFFGHIEHYALPAGLTMAFLYLGARSLTRGTSILPAAFVVTLSTGVHLSMTSMIPALLFLIAVRAVRSASFRQGLLRTLLAVLVVGLPAFALWFAMQEVGYLRSGEKGFGGGDRMMFVPLETLRGKSRYLFLRPDHLIAIMNQQLLTAPVALWSIVLLLGSFAWRRLKRGRALRPGDPEWIDRAVPVFTALAAFGFFGLTVVWHPDLGPKRDWSLFAPGAFFLSMLLALLVVQRWKALPGRAFACLTLFSVVTLQRTLPWLLENL